jgi:hypothetical protein
MHEASCLELCAAVLNSARPQGANPRKCLRVHFAISEPCLLAGVFHRAGRRRGSRVAARHGQRTNAALAAWFGTPRYTKSERKPQACRGFR